MKFKAQLPQDFDEDIVLKCSELNPEAVVALIECLSEQKPNDRRVDKLKALWDELTR